MNVNQYIGIPFKEKGRDPDTGFDCWGLVRYVYEKELGIYLPSYTECYNRTVDRHNISTKINQEKEDWLEIKRSFRRQFDIVLMHRLGANMHVGVLVDENNVLHVEDNKSSPFSRCVSLTSFSIASSIVGFYRHADYVAAQSIHI